jgi:6-phosphofructokinase 2
MNVARSLRRLGYACRLVVPLGDSSDCSMLRAECRSLDIDAQVVRIGGALRTCVVLVDEPSGTSTLISEAGPELTASEVAQYEAVAAEAVPKSSFVICSGSLPPGLPADFYARIARLGREEGVRCLVDTSGLALQQVLAMGAWGVKVNGAEVAAATSTAGAVEAASVVTAHGVTNVVITRGPRPALYVGEAGRLEVSSPNVKPVNPTAAGDAFLAALAGGLSRHSSWSQALAAAAAAATRVTAQFGPDLGPDPQLASLMSEVTVTAW